MRTRIEVALTVVAFAVLFVLSVRLQASEDARRAAERVRDSLAIENVAAEAEAAGWEVRFGDMERDLTGKVATRDEMMASLARSLDRANARIRTLVEVVATLTDSLTSVGTPSDTTDAGEVAWNGGIDDGLLTATWRFLPPELALRYSVAVPLEIVTSEGGDGRWLVTARATDPRASVRVGGFWFDPPAPVYVDRCTIRQKATWAAIGGGLSLLLRR